MKLLQVLMVLSLIFNVACSSKGKDGEKREFTKDYVVVDAKEERLPGWLNEPVAWAEKNDDEFKKNHYFVSTTGLIENQRLCEKSAEAQAAAKIAGEIAQFIKNSYAQSVQGDSNDEVETYMEDTLAQEIQSFLVGAKLYRNYWEKRKYSEELGAEENKTGLICSALMKIEKSVLKNAIKNSQEKLMEQATNPESKKKVGEAIKDAEAKFDAI